MYQLIRRVGGNTRVPGTRSPCTLAFEEGTDDPGDTRFDRHEHCPRLGLVGETKTTAGQQARGKHESGKGEVGSPGRDRRPKT